ncbi:MAG: YhfG family protein [Colwellia sp.]
MLTEKQLKARFESKKKENYLESLRLEGISARTGKIKSKRVAQKISELKAQYA